MPAENIVEVHHLKKSVGQGEHELSILTGVELVVKRGETIALVGESGSGKSTLLAILAGLDDGSSGEVSLVGQPLHNMDEEARAKLRAKHVGFVFQSFMLIPTLNALENVELPALLRGESIMLCPDVAYDSAAPATGEIYKGFLQLEKLYHAGTGAHLRFVPVYCGKTKRIVTGEPVCFSDGAPFRTQREEVAGRIVDGLNALAAACGELGREAAEKS